MEYFTKHSLNAFHSLKKMIDYTECDHAGVSFQWFSSHFLFSFYVFLSYNYAVPRVIFPFLLSNDNYQGDSVVISAFLVVTF